uniref:Peptidase M48 domain-containing protein n=1 Tax=Aegilops tauschii TaxID=37682 RepID=R7WA05_AEGTA
MAGLLALIFSRAIELSLDAQRLGTSLRGTKRISDIVCGYQTSYDGSSYKDHALAVAKKYATIAGGYSVWKQILDTTHPHPRDRLARLSEIKTMEEALELYNEANAMDKVTEKYFSGNPGMSIADENGISKFEK